jgi:hypothetical protein
MKEHPIIMTGWSVRAILDSRKYQTRRVIKPQPSISSGGESWQWHYAPTRYVIGAGMGLDALHQEMLSHCPYGVPGDRLWVRHTFYHAWRNAPAEHAQRESVWDPFTRTVRWKTPHKVDGCEQIVSDCEPDVTQPWWEKRSSRFMPRWASRITLEVVNIRVERLQEISFDDAIAEGVCEYPPDAHGMRSECRRWFEELWDEINAKRGYGYSWDVNPWVFVIEFRRVEP